MVTGINWRVDVHPSNSPNMTSDHNKRRWYE